MPINLPDVIPAREINQALKHVEAFGGSHIAAVEAADCEAMREAETRSEIAAFIK